MLYSFRYRRRLTKPPTLQPMLVEAQPLVVVERIDPRLQLRDDVTQSSAQR